MDTLRTEGLAWVTRDETRRYDGPRRKRKRTSHLKTFATSQLREMLGESLFDFPIEINAKRTKRS